MKKDLNNHNHKQNDMGLLGVGRGILGLPVRYTALIIILLFIPFIVLFGFLFLFPLIETQSLTVNIALIDNQLEINSMDIVNIKKPLINIFSKSNPISNYRLKIDIVEIETDKRISESIENVGLGKSIFPISEDRLEGAIELTIGLHLDKKLLDFEGKKITIPKK